MKVLQFYLTIAEPQDFAILRMLLAILLTVFSRYDAKGHPYLQTTLQSDGVPIGNVDEDELEDYIDALFETWDDLWERGTFPEIVYEYLGSWREHFFLFDETYPFFQVTEKEIEPGFLSKPNGGIVRGKTWNRLISESENKQALFSPKSNDEENRNYLSDDQIARWLLTLHGYVGLGDKIIFGKQKYTSSKGWLFDIGGLYLKGANLFETLMFNMTLVHPMDMFNGTAQRPCWEFSPEDVLKRRFSDLPIDNLAEQYTLWSRAIFINSEAQEEGFVSKIVKIPDIPHMNAFLEPMTVWRFNENRPLKNSFTPMKHKQEISLWRSFGLFTLGGATDSAKHVPGIIQWYRMLPPSSRKKQITLQAVSMKDDGNATSWSPVDVIADELVLQDFMMNEETPEGWVIRIHQTVEITKQAVSGVLGYFLDNVEEIRNVRGNSMKLSILRDFYFNLDPLFQEWLLSLDVTKGKEDQIYDWLHMVKGMVIREAKSQFLKASERDLLGIVKGERIWNIASAYQLFLVRLNRLIETHGEKDERHKSNQKISDADH